MYPNRALFPLFPNEKDGMSLGMNGANTIGNIMVDAHMCMNNQRFKSPLK